MMKFHRSWNKNKMQVKLGRKIWLKICVVYLTVVSVIAASVISYLKVFTLLPYPMDSDVDDHLNEVFNGSQGFPKIIHHCWKNELIPDEWLTGYNSCINLNTEYEHMLWTHEKMDIFFKTEYPWFYHMYNSYQHRTQKLDVFRYFVMYHYGGVYLDLDLPCKAPFKSIITNDISQNYTAMVADEWAIMLRTDFLAAKKHHPLFKEAIRSLPYAASGYGIHYMDVMAGTGPYFFTRCLQNFENKEEVYHLPMAHWKWKYFDHPFSMFWASWYERWLLNSWLGWILLFCVSFFIVGMFTYKWL